MAHSMLEASLQAASKSALDAGNPMLFLNRLEAIHNNWHRRTFSARRLGFLVFHWTVIEEFKRAKSPSIWRGGIRPFRPKDFTDFGWSYNVSTRASNQDINSLADFSGEIESWHNEAHMAVGMSFGIESELMDPEVNIYYQQFWRLHYFINARFLRELRRYDPTGSAIKKIDRLENNQHINLYRI
jgi:hypothetical protein